MLYVSICEGCCIFHIHVEPQDYTEMQAYTRFKRESVDLYSEWREVLKDLLLERSQLVLSDCLGEGTCIALLLCMIVWLLMELIMHKGI